MPEYRLMPFTDGTWSTTSLVSDGSTITTSSLVNLSITIPPNSSLRAEYSPSAGDIYSGLANNGPFVREVVIDNDSFIKLIQYMGAPTEHDRKSVTVITRYGSLKVRNQKYVLSLDDLFEDVPHKFAK